MQMPIRAPGTRPPAKSVLTDLPAMTQNGMNSTLGGTMGPMVEAQAASAEAYSRL